MSKSLLVVSFLLTHFGLLCQFSISGRVLNENEEHLELASIYLEGEKFATTSDSKGFFTLTDIPTGNYTLKASYLGYKDHSMDIQVSENIEVDIILKGSIYSIDNIEIVANKLSNAGAPFSYVNIDKKEISRSNLAQDMPQILQFTPSLVATSDAGNGIGYTGLRIRGTDPTRVNVTINGIPLNDAESQNVYWVDLPDLASSVENIQIQRGVGSSTSGAGAFGASVLVNTHQVHQNPYAIIDASYGSFDTRKYNVRVGSGLMNDKFSVDFRYSSIDSDGYIDRATSRLDSWALSLAKLSPKGSIRFDVMSGSEVTYQSWNGAPESKVKGDADGLESHYNNNLGTLYNTPEDSINLFSSDRRYNYYSYEDQVDDYQQDHYQFHIAQMLSDKLTFNGSLHYTYGRGFFEEFRYQDDLSFYGLAPFINSQNDTLRNANLVRRRWLENDYYGALANLRFEANDQLDFLLGAAFHEYQGLHFGQLISHEYDESLDSSRRYYENNGEKSDFNIYLKSSFSISKNLKSFIDLQYRSVKYAINGIENGSIDLSITDDLIFFNPKIGLSYALASNKLVYASLGIANREPDRNDYISDNNRNNLKHESLRNLELGYRSTESKINYELVAYLMDYTDQLVLTGELNDVGATLRSNVDDSYRMGLEISAGAKLSDRFKWQANLTLSHNKIKAFKEILYDYTNGEEIIENEFSDTDISYSPSVIAGSVLTYKIYEGLELGLRTKYVGTQYLDNTSNENRSLDSYIVNDITLTYAYQFKIIKNLSLNFTIQNILNEGYSSNGYSYSYVYGDLITENFLYPQAGRNYMLGASVKF